MPFAFKFTNCSSATANDGYLPYDDDISSVDITTTISGLVNTDLMSVANNVVVLPMTYPGTAGIYKITFELTLESGAILEADFNRVKALNL